MGKLREFHRKKIKVKIDAHLDKLMKSQANFGGIHIAQFEEGFKGGRKAVSLELRIDNGTTAFNYSIFTTGCPYCGFNKFRASGTTFQHVDFECEIDGSNYEITEVHSSKNNINLDSLICSNPTCIEDVNGYEKNYVDEVVEIFDELLKEKGINIYVKYDDFLDAINKAPLSN